MLRKDEKTAVIEANRTHETDTGSPEVSLLRSLSLQRESATLQNILRHTRRTTTQEVVCSR